MSGFFLPDSLAQILGGQLSIRRIPAAISGVGRLQ